jgi:hypothetical protein
MAMAAGLSPTVKVALTLGSAESASSITLTVSVPPLAT